MTRSFFVECLGLAEKGKIDEWWKMAKDNEVHWAEGIHMANADDAEDNTSVLPFSASSRHSARKVLVIEHHSQGRLRSGDSW